jgi:dipeptidyl aminopeptidase/acylaminoacyl peptidase
MRVIFFLIAFSCGIALVSTEAADAAEKIDAPMAIDDVLDTRRFETRGGVTFSHDAAWVTQVFQITPEVFVDGGNWRMSATGVAQTEGNGIRRLRLTRVRDGKTIDLGSGEVSTWGASWSPDNKQLAYYSDEGGEAGLWIWTVATQTVRRVGQIIARSGFTFEMPLWIDKQRVITKALPVGISVQDANRLAPSDPESRDLPPPPRDGRASVAILSSKQSERTESDKTRVNATAASVVVEQGELALIDTNTGEAKRLTGTLSIRGYALSPDRRWLTYSNLKGNLANAQQPIFDVRLIDLQSGSDRVLIPDAALAYGHEYSWSPDSKRLALIMADKKLAQQLFVVDLNGELASLEGGLPATDHSDEDFDLRRSKRFAEWPPLWSGSGDSVYAIFKGALWRFDPASGKASRAVQSSGKWLMRIATLEGSGLAYGPKPGTLLIIARDEATKEAQFLQIDTTRGRTQIVFSSGRRSVVVDNLAVSKTGKLAFGMRDATKLTDLWLLDPRKTRLRQLSQLNPQLDRYLLGEAQTVRWTSTRGEPREGILMLPPGYKRGSPLPLFVFVYGSDSGAGNLVNHYSLGWGEIPTFNFHVLTTRGYALFYPDLPIQRGELIESFMDSINPGLDMLIKKGFADPGRMAISGQSFGSYTTWSVITQTTRFKAAITTANALHPDLIADYLRLRHDGTPMTTGYYENGQGNMGGTPWDQRERYLKNSPVTYLDRIQTPLLMGQGSLDGLTASDALYAGLLRLGKSVEYRIYPGEDHVIQFRGNVRDFWQRRLEFLDEHLGTGKSKTTQ